MNQICILIFVPGAYNFILQFAMLLPKIVIKVEIITMMTNETVISLKINIET